MIDARGLSCPEPVILAMKEIDAKHPATMDVIVDNAAAVENVSRLGKAKGYQVSKTSQNGETTLHFAK